MFTIERSLWTLSGLVFGDETTLERLPTAIEAALHLYKGTSFKLLFELGLTSCACRAFLACPSTEHSVWTEVIQSGVDELALVSPELCLLFAFLCDLGAWGCHSFLGSCPLELEKTSRNGEFANQITNPPTPPSLYHVTLGWPCACTANGTVTLK